MNLSIDNGIQHFIEYVKEEFKDIKNKDKRPKENNK